MIKIWNFISYFNLQQLPYLFSLEGSDRIYKCEIQENLKAYILRERDWLKYITSFILEPLIIKKYKIICNLYKILCELWVKVY